MALAHDIAALVGFEERSGAIARSAHPFTSSPHAGDVRFTTRLDRASPLSNIGAVMHELGHALYEQGLPAELDRALTVLTNEGRVELGKDGRLQAPARYHVLTSDQFHHRVDALNHFLDGMYRSVLHRLVFDDREGSMVKAITFTALPSSLQSFVARFEGELRRSIAGLEGEAQFQGKTDTRFTMGVTLAPTEER